MLSIGSTFYLSLWLEEKTNFGLMLKGTLLFISVATVFLTMALFSEKPMLTIEILGLATLAVTSCLLLIAKISNWYSSS